MMALWENATACVQVDKCILNPSLSSLSCTANALAIESFFAEWKKMFAWDYVVCTGRTCCTPGLGETPQEEACRCLGRATCKAGLHCGCCLRGQQYATSIWDETWCLVTHVLSMMG